MQGQGFDPWSGKTPHATGQLSSCATTAEARMPKACALEQEKPLQWEAWAPQLEKSLHSDKDAAQPKIIKNKQGITKMSKVHPKYALAFLLGSTF